MVRENEVRDAEVTIEPPAATDAGLVFIGRIRTPWTSRLVAPRQGRIDGPVCRIEVFEPWIPALQGLEAYSRIEVLYWLHLSRRDLVLQSPANDRDARGTFSLRSPARPNPTGTAIALLQRIDGGTVYVRGLAYLEQNKGLEAAAEFEKVLKHRGIVLYDPIATVSRWRLGQAYALAGDVQRSKAAYDDFLTLWKNADPDIPILKKVRSERAALQ